LDVRISQGNVATYCRWDGNFCNIYMAYSVVEIAL